MNSTCAQPVTALPKRAGSTPFGRSRCPSQLLAGWCALLLYLAVNSPLGLGLAALAGSLDPTHQVRIHAGEKGFELTLHHGLSCAMHRHGAMARMLTAFAQPAAAANPDHVLQFRANDTFSREVQIGFPRASLSEQPLLAFVPQSFEWSRADLTLAGPPQLPSPGQAMARSLPPTILLL